MFYQPFNERYPAIAEAETRCLLVFNDPELPTDKYALIEAYCNEPGCDCRRVIFNVHARDRGEIVAVITYGWEKISFYEKWLGFHDAEVLHELKGPALNTASIQSELSYILLDRIKIVLQDRNYVERLKRHYTMFKKAVESERPSRNKSIVKDYGERINRNAPCPCGSGLKYKKCCGKLRIN